MAIDPLDIDKTLKPDAANAPETPEDLSLGEVPTQRAELQRRHYRVGTVLLGRYRITGELGQGGMGIVFRSFDEVGGINVALKALPPELSHNTVEMEEVRDNFQLVQGLHHPNIAAVKTLEKDTETTNYYLVMECVEGVNLRQWRKQGDAGTRPLSESLSALRQVAEALDYAHSRKIIHRDVKPSNVMIAADGTVKVLDFGLAAQIHTSMTRVSQVRYGTSGTGPYMAPEQWEGDYQDAATDQYALAVMTYELLSGRLPFENPDISVLREAVLKTPPRPIPGLNARVWKALQVGLGKARDGRYPSCGGFVAALEGRKLRNTPKSRKGKGKWLAAAALVLALGAGAYLAYPHYQAYQARVAAEAEAAQQADAQDAVTRARIAELRQAIESDLSSGDLAEAGRLLSDLETVAGTTSVSSALRQRYESLAGERETNRRFADASLARDRVQRVAPGQTLGSHLETLERKWLEAEAARSGRSWGQALSGYDAVLAIASRIETLDQARSTAAEQRSAAETTQRDSRSADAATDAAALWTTGQQSFSRAATAFDAGEFETASSAWTEATTAYERAAARARAVQSYHKAKSDYETELGGPTSMSAVLLEAHGGALWEAAKGHALRGEVSANDPTAGRAAYEQALRGLPAAVSQAQAAKRAAEINAHLTSARQAKERERWQEVVTAADRVLALDTNNREAHSLKREAQGNLVPTWRIVTTVDGREVPATIMIGDRTWTAPHTFTLEDGKRYTAGFSYEAGGRRYTAESVSVTANWKGEELRRLVLQEQTEPRAGENRTIDLGGGVSLELVWIPPGNYLRGSTKAEQDAAVAAGTSRSWVDRENPQHRVTLTKGFWMGKYAVTQDQWQRVMGNNPSSFKGPKNPVESVSWNECQEFMQKLNAILRAGNSTLGTARLPTEAEWEYACRAGTTTAFHYGNDLDASMANFNGNYPYGNGRKGEYRQRTVPVGSFRPNAWGLYDMHGNVWEWCQDWYGSYPSGAVTDPAGPSSGSSRVLRGGSWNFNAGRCRSAYRSRYDPSARVFSRGFRVVVSR